MPILPGLGTECQLPAAPDLCLGLPRLQECQGCVSGALLAPEAGVA